MTDARKPAAAGPGHAAAPPAAGRGNHPRPTARAQAPGADPRTRAARTILVAGEPSIRREGLTCVLDPNPHVTVQHPAAALAELPDRLRGNTPDAVVLTLPAGPAAANQLADATAAIREARTEPALIVVSPTGEGLVRALIDAGPTRSAYLLEDNITGSDALVGAIQYAIDGVVFLDSTLVTLLVGGRNESPLQKLTARERQVLAEIAAGHSNKAIAEHLQLSGKAIEGHVTAVFKKLNLAGDTDHDRRVAAALLYLSQADSPRPPSG